MDLRSNDFELFDIPLSFKQDRTVLDARWRALQTQVHPDRFVTQGAPAQRLAMQWSVRVNEAYQRLKHPLQRAAYLCELAGAPIEADSNTSMPSAFLLQQIAWRETLADQPSAAAILALQREVAQYRQTLLSEIEHQLDQRHNPPAAVLSVRALMFVERFAQDLSL
jgi:molecular chaperone HscB